MTFEPDEPVENPAWNSESVQPSQEKPAEVSQVQLNLRVDPGTSLHVTIDSQNQEDISGKDRSAENQVIYQSNDGRILVVSTQHVVGNSKKKAIYTGTTSAWLRKISSLFDLPAPRLAGMLFVGSGLVYLIIHLVGLLDFPIYFFCDEAASTIQALDFINYGLRDFRGDLLPTFFLNGGQFCLGTSVYLQTVIYFLFGKTEWIVRFTTVLISLLAVLWLALILRKVFNKSLWWSSVLLLGLTPAWFLTSRTGFEYTLLVALFTGFLYYYLLYRLKNPKYLYVAILLGSLTFYSYTPGQVIMVVIGLMLLISDWRYHWQQPRVSLPGLALLAVLALPLFRFILQHPQDYFGRLALYNSYWVGDGTIFQKVGTFLSTWLSGLDPFYWFFPNSKDLPVYSMKGYANIALPFFPLTALGMWNVLKRLRQSEYRLVLFSFLAAPAGAAMVSIDVNRTLVIVMPVIVLTVFGLEIILEWFKNNLRVTEQLLFTGLFLGLCFTGIWMLRDALVNGPTWYANYGLNGMQYGARQVFLTAQKYHTRNPSVQVLISPNWSFQTPVLARFFLPSDSPIQIGTADSFMQQYKPEISSTLFVLTPSDYQKVQSSGFFTPTLPELVIPYPDGNPGFYFVRLQYQDNIQQIFATQEEKRHQLIYSTLSLDGQSVDIGYSALDMGPISNAFDGDPDTLIKSSEANPLILELTFSQERRIRGITASVGAEPVRLSTYLYSADGTLIQKYSTEAGEVEGYKDMSIDFGEELVVKKLRIEIMDTLVPEPGNVHLWELKLN